MNTGHPALLGGGSVNVHRSLWLMVLCPCGMSSSSSTCGVGAEVLTWNWGLVSLLSALPVFASCILKVCCLGHKHLRLLCVLLVDGSFYSYTMHLLFCRNFPRSEGKLADISHCAFYK